MTRILGWKGAVVALGMVGTVGLAAAQNSVTVNLNGVRMQDGRTEVRTSAPNALAPGFLYRSQVTAMVRGRGLVLGLLYSVPEPLDVVLEELAPGSSDILDQFIPNFGGTLPVTIPGERVEGVTVINNTNVTYGLTASAQIDATGVASFRFDDVVLRPVALGYFEVTNGSALITRVPGVLAGQLDLDGYTGDASGLVGRLELLNGSGGVIEAADVAIDPTGRFVTAFAFRGTANARMVVPGWLSRRIGSVTVNNDQQGGLAVALVNGDIDRDNSVSVFDYDVLSRNFDKGVGDADWLVPDPSDGIAPLQADLDGDGSVSVFDYDILSRNFDRTGD